MHYRVRSLDSEGLRQAFSLVQAVHPRLSLERWRRFARPNVERRRRAAQGPRRGILSLEDQRGCILALFAFRVEPDLIHGCLLHCEYLAAVDLLNPRQALRVLIEAIRQRARLTGCGAIRVATPRTLAALADELSLSGFAGDGVNYALAMDPGRRLSAAIGGSA